MVLVIACLVFCVDTGRAGASPERIVSLAPSLTEEIYTFGAQESLVGRTTYCRIPDTKRVIEIVGTVVEVNLEKIVSLKPDLVVATSLTELRAVEKMKLLGMNVVVFPMAKDFSELCAQMLVLGKLVGKEA
ncbi:MAG: helical backbone metal receptor, partial [Candidatus Omnitrophota bacterium]